MLDREEEIELQREIKRCELEYLNEIKEDLKQILHEALMDTVFSYSPMQYQRTNQLENLQNIDFQFNDNNLFIYINTDNMIYYSNENKSTPVDADKVVHFLEVGHDVSGDYARDSNSTYNYWNNYPAQYFLELAQQRIQSKYPDLIVQVIRDQPNL